MRPYGMRGLAALALMTGVAFAVSPLGEEAERVAQRFLPSSSGAQYAAAELASGHEVGNDATNSAAEEAGCSLIARPDRVAYGGSTILEWQTKGMGAASIGGIGEVPLFGSRVVNGLTASETFMLSASPPADGVRCSARVEVLDPLEKPTCLISVHPSVAAEGDEILLSWGSEGAGVAYVTDFDRVEARGGRTIVANRSQDYVLTVFSPLGQSSTCSARLTVE